MELQTSTGGSVTVADSAFGQEYKEGLVHQVVTTYLAGARAGTKAQKNRAAVSGGGAKPWRQKGTGRARAGTIRSPLWRSGGVTFAAQPRDFSKKINRKMYRAAIRSIFSELARQDRLVIVDQLDLDAAKTKALLAKLNEWGASDALLIDVEIKQNIGLASRNLPKVEVTDTVGIDPVLLVGHEKVVITVDALKKVEEWLA